MKKEAKQQVKKTKNSDQSKMTNLESEVAKTNPDFVKWLKSKKGK